MDKTKTFSNLSRLGSHITDDKHSEIREQILNYFNDNKILSIEDYKPFKIEKCWSFFIENLDFFKKDHNYLYLYVIEYANDNNLIIEINKLASSYMKTASLLKIGEDKYEIINKLNKLNNNINFLYMPHKKHWLLRLLRRK